MGKTRVVPGDPTNSLLLQKLRGATTTCGSPMPVGGDEIPEADFKRISDWISSPLPIIMRSLSSLSLSLATASAASPESSVELLHKSGSESVVDATYFCMLSSIAL